MQKQAAAVNDNNNVSCYGSTFVKATGVSRLPVDSGRGPAAVKVTCENTEAANPFVVVI